ncbi:unnamed protein product [Prorocentrum cordatum]|uniref:Uncharacterized protein n=1 Tax=Prorocentrum cordatum TaxID=2364126 RepID=A0ABN9R3N5_9DINO|nr:unnamed protein product [Polarella glacialis]
MRHRNERYAFAGELVFMDKQTTIPFLGALKPRQVQEMRGEAKGLGSTMGKKPFQQPPQRHRQDHCGGGGLGGVMANFNNVMEDIQSVGEMASLATQKAQAKQARESAAEQGPAKELAQALAAVVRPAAAAAPNDSRLEGTVERLAEFALPGSGASGSAGIDVPEVKRLRADLDALTSRVDAQSKAISEIKAVSTENQVVCKQTQHLMSRPMDKFDRIQAPGGGRVGDHAGPPAEEGALDPFFQQQVPFVAHTGVAPILGVQGNAQFKGMKEGYPRDGIPYVTLWESVAKLKSLDQWRKKLVSLGSENEAVQDLDKGGIGTYLFRLLTADGEIAGDALQPAPSAA